MRIAGVIALPLLLLATSDVFTQTPSPPPAGPTFDVVSIKRNTTSTPVVPPPILRPDGGFTMTNIPVIALINQAYPFSQTVPTERIALPGWATTDRYDVSTTSTLTRATPEDRAAMIRAMLADRFKLVAHVERVDQPVYDLVLARSDGKLGSGLTQLNVDCAAQVAAARVAAEAARGAGTPPPPPQRPDYTAPMPPCTLRSVGASLRDAFGDKLGRLGDILEGEGTMDALAGALRLGTGRFVVNKTGLPGSYRVNMNYDMMAGMRGPAAAPPPDAVASVFTAVQEQLGLKLESSRALGERLVIDRLERPTED
jgi:uncharacterized protein (TIGR03435 family)